MNNGALIFAHNNRDVDYALMSIISGGLAKKHLKIPVSLVSDQSTIQWMKESGSYERAESLFDQIILTDRIDEGNTRYLADGNKISVVPFLNAGRYSAYDLTPYENTLLLDSDFLIFSDVLNNFWGSEDVLLSDSMLDVEGSRKGILDNWVSETGVRLYWATTVMFKKNEIAKLFFDLVYCIKTNYNYFSDVYRFNPSQYRNDISFSIAKHIMSAYGTDHVHSLPPVKTVQDKDILESVDIDGRLLFLIHDLMDANKFTATRIKGSDVHVMNKQSIVRNSEKLLELV